MKKQRIWELDAFRGLCILGMIVIHFFFDLRFFAGVSIDLPEAYFFVKQYGHVLFILISGICATLATKTLRRGLIVFGCGLLVTYVTTFMEEIIGISDIRIWFGILHLLGVCMMLYPLFRKLPFWALSIIGAGFVVLGFWMKNQTVFVDYLFPIGLCSNKIFTGSDFFPLFPGLGWFLVGSAIGKILYRNKQTLFPKAPTNFFLIRFLRFVGRHSLEIYLLHQPILVLVTALLFG